MSDLPKRVLIDEEGPREGFQSEKKMIPVPDKVRLIEAPERSVQLARPFLTDDLALDFNFVRIEPDAAHPVGLDRQSELPTVGRKCKPVMRTVFTGLGVGLAGCHEHQAVDFPLGKAIGALEQHVLDEMGKPREAGRLIK